MKTLPLLLILCGIPLLSSAGDEVGAAVFPNNPPSELEFENSGKISSSFTFLDGSTGTVHAAEAHPMRPSALSTPFVLPTNGVISRISHTNGTEITTVVCIEKIVTKYLPPSNMVMRLFFNNELTREPIFDIQITTPRRVAFAGATVEEE